ncbi:kinesin-domain-containing protein [Suhomyces tanzawaensis NRRL Y-17324]|uniref:Kinesin-like protein n=1 Tax=Suhomyces tanzawaensis NRRL Y-17324 TaxID=984487 RepID=A0A1E4SNW0_9ASCO|nr:kinesin-domain-containing protein [Suhomyces tanzawaensis NRRL Y-17324]ODV81211.1 kinesin-domain-containing protein [Suhomyces tanzawaensis NRRL Y-17324]
MSNIQVVVRCRGRNSREVAAKSPIVIELPNDRYSVTDPYITINTAHHTGTNPASASQSASFSGQSSHERGGASVGTGSRRSSGPSPALPYANYKTYKVDQIYGSQADQGLVFDQVALPLFNDFMGGFNVTILAYGQTGTGKTYTMCGDQTGALMTPRVHGKGESPRVSPLVDLRPSKEAGIIPRVLIELFHRLRRDDYVVKCSFLELYNEELRDLLEDDTRASKLRIYENVSAQPNPKKPISKSSKGIIIQNLNEEYISSCNDGLKLLSKGLNKRKTASTKLNDVSSRSHTIFTINLYRKKAQEGTNAGSGGDELFKVSKMNLVDLAGSENINRSGAVNQRAKEAGLINQSLLTLGRVINCLSETSTATPASHIPYRESKLTRLLQDSIGGSTKTTLIANISPAKINIDETISTLDYASKAKNIKNVPQAGHDSELVMKKVLVKNLSQEIVKLNSDLLATRTKNGIWMNEDNYNEMNDENESLKSSLKESDLRNEGLTSKVGQLEDQLSERDLQILELQAKVTDLTKANSELKLDTDTVKHELAEKNEQVISLNGHITRINERFNNTSTKLTTVIYENLKKSIESINTITNNYDNAKNCDEILKLDNEMVRNINKFKQEVLERIRGINENVNSSFVKDLPEFLDQYNQSFNHINDIILSLNSNLVTNLSELKSANHSMAEYLTNHHLEKNADKLVTDFINKKLADDVEKLNLHVSAQVNGLIKDSQAKYQSLIKSSINQMATDLINSEKIQLNSFQKDWSEITSKALLSIEEDLTSYNSEDVKANNEHFDKLNQEAKTTLTTLNEKNSKSLASFVSFIEREEKGAHSILRKHLPAKLSQISNSIAENDSNINESLSGISRSLNEIKQFDTKNGFRVSPVKLMRSKSFQEASNSSIPSPNKAQRLLSLSPTKLKAPNGGQESFKSKIPQLTRTLENKENDGHQSKRRRVEE